MSTCHAWDLNLDAESLHICARDHGHDGPHRDHDGTREWGEDPHPQVRGDLAPTAPRSDSWSPAAAASLAAGALLNGHTTEDRWARYDATAVPRERRAILVDRLIADAIRLGERRERVAATQRVYAWAATLTKVDEALIAAKAAEVVQAGR